MSVKPSRKPVEVDDETRRRDRQMHRQLEVVKVRLGRSGSAGGPHIFGGYLTLPQVRLSGM